jgi:hypothetical protein
VVIELVIDLMYYLNATSVCVSLGMCNSTQIARIYGNFLLAKGVWGGGEAMVPLVTTNQLRAWPTLHTGPLAHRSMLDD